MAVVSLTFDDGLNCHLDTVIPILEKERIRGTFYLNVGSEIFASRYEDWKNIAQKGHELGNHSIFHPAKSSYDWISEGTAIEHYSLDRMFHELNFANTVLSMLDNKQSRSFAFPCGNPYLGSPGLTIRTLSLLDLQNTRIGRFVNKYNLDLFSSVADFTPIIEKLFYSARCGGASAHNLDSATNNRYQVKGFEIDLYKKDQLNDLVDEVVDKNIWAIFVFHGVGGEHTQSCTTDLFEQLIQRITTDKDIQALTFLEAAKEQWKD